MKGLNKCILIAMNHKSTLEELRENRDTTFATDTVAYSYADTVDDAYFYAVYAVADAAYTAAINYNKYLNEYFEVTDGDIQDYLDEIKRINKKGS